MPEPAGKHNHRSSCQVVLQQNDVPMMQQSWSKWGAGFPDVGMQNALKHRRRPWWPS